MAPGASPYLPPTRGPSSRTTLSIQWEHATHARGPAPAGERSSAVQQRQALAAEEAFAAIAGNDRRPLLVLRECFQCSGTEDALMSSKEDNEHTYLLSRWFHCVKLSPDVLEDDHPFRNLFPGASPSHLFVSNWDGSQRHDLEGEHSRRELWGAMEKALEASYADSHSAALRELAKILDQLDEVDRVLADLAPRYELTVAEGDSAKVKKLKKKLTEARGKRADLIAAAVKASALELKPHDPAAR